MVNYIDATDYTSFRQNYPDAYAAYIKLKNRKINLDTFVYVPM